MTHDRISTDPSIMGGKPCVAGTRIPVDILLDYLGSGQTITQVLDGYPALTEDDVLAAIRFAADHVRTRGFVAV